jgi:VWFA-related protein
VVLALLVTLDASLRSQRRGQMDVPTFRAGIDIVELTVSVLDGARSPVRGLTAADFTVLEDGKNRPITAFAEITLSGPSTRADVGASASSANVARVDREGRLVIILLDRSIPVGAPARIARLVAKEAVNALGPDDLAAVIRTGSSEASQDLTSDRERLLARIDGRQPGSDLRTDSTRDEVARDRTEAELWTGDRVPRVIPDFDISGECMCGLCVPETITHIANQLRDLPRRTKTVLFIGTEIAIESRQVQCSGRVRDARNAMFRALELSHVTVHTFDASGLETRLIAAGSNVQGKELTSAISPAQGSTGMAQRMVRRQMERQGNLAVLPDRTGGRFVLNSNDPQLLVGDVFRENASYYVLGFSPAAPADGKRHEIRVRVSRRGVDVHTRRAYQQQAAPAR